MYGSKQLITIEQPTCSYSRISDTRKHRSGNSAIGHRVNQQTNRVIRMEQAMAIGTALKRTRPFRGFQTLTPCRKIVWYVMTLLNDVKLVCSDSRTETYFFSVPERVR